MKITIHDGESDGTVDLDIVHVGNGIKITIPGHEDVTILYCKTLFLEAGTDDDVRFTDAIRPTTDKRPSL